MLTRQEHTRLRQIWHAALDLVIFGEPNHWEDAHERWVAAAPKIHEAFTQFLEDHDPYRALETPPSLHPDRSADRGGLDSTNEMPRVDGI